MGCLFALFAGVFPRLALLIVWIARPATVDAALRPAPASATRSRAGAPPKHRAQRAGWVEVAPSGLGSVLNRPIQVLARRRFTHLG
jgi:hypothetical protein